MCKLRIAQYYRCICIKLKSNLLFLYSVYWTAHFASIRNHSMTDWGLKGLLEVSWSNPSAQMGSPIANCPGPHPEAFRISPKPESLLPPWAACTSAQWHHREKVLYLNIQMDSCISECAHCLCPDTRHHRYEFVFIFAAFLQVLIHMNEPCPPQDRESQLSQPFLIWDMLLSCHLCGP